LGQLDGKHNRYETEELTACVSHKKLGGIGDLVSEELKNRSAKYNEGKTEENLQAIADLTGEDIDLLQQACWPAIRNDGWIDFSALEPYLQWNIETGQMDFTITEEQFWDPSILEAALELINYE